MKSGRPGSPGHGAAEGSSPRSLSPVVATARLLLTVKALAGTFLYLLVVSAGFEAADDRYRLPLVPIACVYAARALAGPPGARTDGMIGAA